LKIRTGSVQSESRRELVAGVMGTDSRAGFDLVLSSKWGIALKEIMEEKWLTLY
jgi:hypothetical protein